MRSYAAGTLITKGGQQVKGLIGGSERGLLKEKKNKGRQKQNESDLEANTGCAAV